MTYPGYLSVPCDFFSRVPVLKPIMNSFTLLSSVKTGIELPSSRCGVWDQRTVYQA